MNKLMGLAEGYTGSRVGQRFTWEWENGLLYPVEYLGREEILREAPLTVDANDAELRAAIPQRWYTVKQLWKCRGGGDVQWRTRDGLLVSAERKAWLDLLSSLSEREEDTKQSKLFRQLRQLLESDICYLILEGRNWKRDPEGVICTTQDYSVWRPTGWTTRHLAGLINSWQGTGIRVVYTENITHTVEWVLSTYQWWQKRHHDYLDALERTIKREGEQEDAPHAIAGTTG